jgi:acetylcholinesterase
VNILNFIYIAMMPWLFQTLFLAALPIIGVAIFWFPWLQDVPTSLFPAWNELISSPQVRLPQGLIIGTVLDNKFPAPIEGFMGLPYAQPPIGDRRFRRALPVPRSNKAFEANKYGAM